LAADPLSDTTRKYRRATIGIASALVAVQVFGVRIEDIPAAGLSIKFEENLIPVVLV